MRQTIYVLFNYDTKSVADSIGENIFVNRKVYTDSRILDEALLLNLASTSSTDYFYVINTDTYVLFSEYDLDFKPKEWDAQYVHIWNNSNIVRLFNKAAVLANPAAFTDAAMQDGKVQLKNSNKRIFTNVVSDIVFLSYDEPFADQHYADLQARYPRAKRVHGVKGIYEAHKAAAKVAYTDYFFVVDADAKIVPEFEFDYYPSVYDAQSTHVWYSRNPINDLEYGYGGVKLFSTKTLREYTGSPIDFTTTVSKSFKVVPIVSNVTCFNTDPFSAWRSAFRECAKLASKLIPNQDNTDSEERLRIWCTVGAERDFGDFAIMGANEGMEFGKTHRNQPEVLRLINDFEWLAERFSS